MILPLRSRHLKIICIGKCRIKTLKRINALLKDIRSNGTLEGTGKPEKLKYRPGYSRRIDECNRLVYEMDELQNIKIISCRGHYED